MDQREKYRKRLEGQLENILRETNQFDFWSGVSLEIETSGLENSMR